MLQSSFSKIKGIVILVLFIWVSFTLARNIHEAWATKSAKWMANARISSMIKNLPDGRSPVMGIPTAHYKIIEFSDYQCPFCGIARPVVAKFFAHHPMDVVVYHYEMPLTQIHHYAYVASIAANCAELQGVIEPYQSLLFQHQKEFATLNWAKLAEQAGIKNVDYFRKCVHDETPRKHIDKDIKIGESLGIEGTPTFIINGTLLSGALTEEKLESLYQH